MRDVQLDSLRAAIVQVFPELDRLAFKEITQGWDSLVVEVDDRWIFKLPRDDAAEISLLKEAALLEAIRPVVSMPVPEMSVYLQPRLFSRHQKLHGEHLVTAVYSEISESAKQVTGQQLGQFYAELHGLDTAVVLSAGAEPIPPWRTTQAIREETLPRLPMELRAIAENVLDGFDELTPDPYGITYGHFDGHGWNMAFDVEKGKLNGIFDFGDSGFGPVHQEFIYTSFVSQDLAERVITAYEGFTGRALDRRRIDVLTGVHRLHELAEVGDDPKWGWQVLRSVERWAGGRREIS